MLLPWSVTSDTMRVTQRYPPRYYRMVPPPTLVLAVNALSKSTETQELLATILIQSFLQKM